MPDVNVRLREAREERASCFETQRALLDRAIEENRDLTTEERSEHDRLDARITELGGDDGRSGEIGRLERYRDRLRSEDDPDAQRRGAVLGDGPADDPDGEPRSYQSFAEFMQAEGRQRPNAQAGYSGAFFRLLRGGLTDRAFSRLDAADQRLLDAARGEGASGEEQRALSAVVGPDGGYAVPTTTEGRIIERADEVSPLRQLATILTTSSGEEINIPLEADIGDADWVAENTEYHEADVVLGLAKLRAHKITTVAWVPRELLQDVGFDMEAYLIRVLGRRIGRGESAAYAVGQPVDPANPGKPTGIYSRLTVGTTVPGNFDAAAPVTSGDELIDLQESVDEAYQASATWVLSRDAARAARKLKTNDGQYLLVPGLRDGEADALLGRPVRRDHFLPAAAADGTLAAYGDFREAIIIRDVLGVFIQRLNEVRATRGQIGFLADHRTDINIVNADAVKRLRAAPAAPVV